MKNLILTSSLLFILALLPINNLFAKTTLGNKLKGKILLQVESNGEAWYINPANEKRYYLGKPDDAFNLMLELGLGISESNFNSFNGYASDNLSGKILLRVEANGEAYYVNPGNLKMHYLGRPIDAFRVMRELGLGISNSNLYSINEANSETINWNSYTNELYKFTLAFPKGYSYCLDDFCEVPIPNYSNYRESDNIQYFSFTNHPYPEIETDVTFEILPRKNNLNMSAIEFGKTMKIKNNDKYAPYYIEGSAKEIVFAGQNAYSFDVVNGFKEDGVVYDRSNYNGNAIVGVKIGRGFSGGAGLKKHKVIYFDKDGILYRFIYPLNDNDFEKIVESFTFTD